MFNQEDDIVALFDEFYFIDETVIKPVKENEKALKINFEGGNKAGLIFVFESKLEGADMDMIQKLVCNAMKMSMDDIALVYLDQQEVVSLQELIDVMNPIRMINWGITSWSSSGSLYQLHKHRNTSYLNVDKVSAFHQNIPLKTTLWNHIQTLMAAK